MSKQNKLLKDFSPFEVIQDTIRMYDGYPPKNNDQYIPIYKLLNNKEAVPNTPLLTAIVPWELAQIIIGLVSITEFKVREVITGWNTPVIDTGVYDCRTDLLEERGHNGMKDIYVIITEDELLDWIRHNIHANPIGVTDLHKYIEKSDRYDSRILSSLDNLGYRMTVRTEGIHNEYGVFLRRALNIRMVYDIGRLEKEVSYYLMTKEKELIKETMKEFMISDKLKKYLEDAHGFDENSERVIAVFDECNGSIRSWQTKYYPKEDKENDVNESN